MQGELFLVNSANRTLATEKKGRAVLGRRLQDGTASLLVLAGAVMATIGLVLLPFFARRSWDLAHGPIVKGTVQTRLVSNVDDGEHSGTRLRVFYKFGPTGTEFDGESNVGGSDYERLTEGAPIEVQYSREDPRLSRIVGASTLDWSWSLGALVLAGLVMLVVGGVRWVRRSRNIQRLVDRGIVLEGKIDSTTCEELEEGRALSRVAYTFVKPDGALFTTAESVDDTEARAGAVPSDGTAVRVLYADDKLFTLL